MTRTRRPLLELPPDLAEHRCIGRSEFAALAGVSTKTVDVLEYGDKKKGIAPRSGPPSFTIGRRRLWKLKDVLRWINRQSRAAG